MPQLTPDLCIIGAGSGGLSVAAAAAAFGVPVVLIEKGAMGGDCLNVGCVPSKALIAAADSAEAVRRAGLFGVGAAAPEPNMARVQDHIQRVIAAIAPNDSVGRFSALGVKVIQGEAKFIDPRTVAVHGDTIRARRFVLATGSRPAIPPLPGLADLPYLTNETIFGLTRRPDHLIVLGGGPIGVEIAQAMRRLGSAVTLVDMRSILAREDQEATSVVRTALEADGVMLLEDAEPLRAEQAGAKLRLILRAGDGERIIEGTHLLVATGRKATIDDLGLELARIAVDGQGIIVDKGLKTSNRKVYAIGDCASGQSGGLQFTHVANYHAGLVLRNALFRMPVKASMAAIPRVTYCQPEIASVGLSEAEARRSGQQVQILRWPFSENDRAQAEHRTEGLIKILTTRKGKILGATIVGASAGDLITPWTLAVAKGLSVGDMAGIVFPYPTLSEVSKRVALTHFTPYTAKPWLRRLIGFLRAFG